MKKLIASASVVAVGTASLYTANAAELTQQEAAKPWTVSASLLGFYDDNYNAAPDNSDWKEGSWGLVFKPSAGINMEKGSTVVRAGVDYWLKYYIDRPEKNVDHDFQFNGSLNHRFTERYRLTLQESFIYSAEPDILDSGTPLRADSSAMRNFTRLGFQAKVTENLELRPGIDLLYYDYVDDGAGSYSALLDRVEYLFRLDGAYLVKPDLVALVGYQAAFGDYTSSDYLSATLPPAGSEDLALQGTDRDYVSHYFYGGAEYMLSPTMTVSGKLGAQYTDFKDLPGDDLSPYADLSGKYWYLPDSYVQLGVQMMQYATDVAAPANTVATEENTTANQDRIAVYMDLRHKITPRVVGKLMGQFSYSQFNEGYYDGDSENWFLFGVGLDYKIDQYWSAKIAYNFDNLDSNLSGTAGRGYTRNRVYFGVEAKY